MIVKVDMDSADRIIEKHGTGPDGRVQLYLTNTINRRLGRFMPHRTGYLETKARHVASATSIEVIAPYAVPMYLGVKYVNAKTGKGPAFIPNVGYRYRKGTVLMPTSQPVHYSTGFNALAGPYWDRRMMASDKDAISAEVSRYANGGTK